MQGQPLAGEVEVDETYIGGKSRNRRPSRRRGVRGPSGKAIVVGARSRDGEIRAQHSAGATRRNLLGFVASNVKPGATVYTDEHRAYRHMPGYRHYSVNHSAAQYVDRQAHVYGMESYWAMLKRGYHETLHHVREKHLGRCVTEFAGRQSRRDLGKLAQMELIAQTMVGGALLTSGKPASGLAAPRFGPLAVAGPKDGPRQLFRVARHIRRRFALFFGHASP